MIKMKALRSFGVAGANEGKVKRGREFTAATEQRVRDLEDHGLAYRLAEQVARPQPVAVTEIVPALNEAAVSGPLGFPGGMTGADAPAPSSPQAHPRRRRRSKASADEDLLS